MTPLAPSTTVPARPAARVPTLTPAGLQALLDAARAISQPLTLQSLLEQVAATACEVLQAERASVWLADEAGQRLELRVARDLAPLHASWGRGVVGHCAATHEIVNVADAYADSRFNPEVDRASGFRTRSILALPLVDAAGRLVGVLQLLNKRSGPFDEGDENLATALAAPCAAALTRARMTEQLLAAERLNHELALASELQRATLPATMPVRPGYELHGVFRPASATGGDTYDAALLPQGLLLVLADAAGHGVPAALAVTQLQALLRMAFRLGAGLEDAFRHANDQLAQTLPDGRFVTAFVGLLDEQQHVVRFISGGQSPNLHLAADGTLTVHRAGTFPMGAAPQPATPAARSQPMAPGDWLALLSDGFYEAEDEAGAAFGSTRVVALLRAAAARGAGAAEAADDIVRAVQAHARLPQDDDMTLLLLRRHPA
jgi:phosphoserine phosphatase RsbU/P